MDALLAGLRAAAEPTRLRLLALCAHAELSVSDLTEILAQSQPRVSRHLKLMVDAGLLARFREGSRVYFRLADDEFGQLARTLVDQIPSGDEQLARDLVRLDQINQRRSDLAAGYFRDNAAQWREIRSLHVPEAEVESALLRCIGKADVDTHLDVGTGTGRILELLAPQVRQGIGLDISNEMLTIARAVIEQEGHRHLQVRKGDMYAMPIADDSIDLATLHLVLHFSHDPQAVITEVSRTLRSGGRLIIVDFSAHQEEQLREEHHHERLGFHDPEIQAFFQFAGLRVEETVELRGTPLTVKIWQARRP